MDQLGRPSIGALLELQRFLGLREAEAVRGGDAQTLARWQRELQERRAVRVISGTKGGRPREVRPAQLERSLAAVQGARALLEASEQRYVLTRADGAATTGLKQAVGVYRNACYRAGIQSHSAWERMQAYRDEGCSEREARTATSLDMGTAMAEGATSPPVTCRTHEDTCLPVMIMIFELLTVAGWRQFKPIKRDEYPCRK